ncbi:uncharacterized protein K452DRAFT_33115 [Aplosporella prunicola CBS 121167]|uniref:Uncharacterized protein n=1 Tax=Aplosporella prunicola CBS 121167 TaxID=1176127 RepID=A0A6A6BC05_9PEZI|nr:uncharacterized protein K452DRAFT_33115 [Aplosporella prunicola CBS 121167]KAF2141739.1 hypothetical protein K452DRAFT_33115 [Aplosporella prunicola CBS 121167]
MIAVQFCTRAFRHWFAPRMRPCHVCRRGPPAQRSRLSDIASAPVLNASREPASLQRGAATANRRSLMRPFSHPSVPSCCPLPKRRPSPQRVRRLPMAAGKPWRRRFAQVPSGTPPSALATH